ncbi:MAG: hypothetical protein ABSG27_15950 [Candidatus Acidiferrales bacterium]|jgi:hypothetical protein
MKIVLWMGGIILAAAIGVSPSIVSAQTTAPTSMARSADCAEVAGALPANCVIDISKMNPAGLLVDKYSYMAQPYSFYYFHHMDRLGFRTDWVRKGSDTYPLKEPTKQFSLKYALRGGNYSLDDYFRRNFVTGFLVLHDDQIVVEKYFHGADQQLVGHPIEKSRIAPVLRLWWGVVGCARLI